MEASTQRTGSPSGPRPQPEPAEEPAAVEDDTVEDFDGSDGALAEVIPLPVFDAREEAKKWRF